MDEGINETVMNDFVTESMEHLESIEPDLLILEQAKGRVDDAIINRIFRAMHSIKGSSSFFSFESLTRLSHAMENVFMKFRDGELIPDPDRMDPIFHGVDKIRLMLQDVRASNQIPCEEEIRNINAIAEQPTHLKKFDCPVQSGATMNSRGNLHPILDDSQDAVVNDLLNETMERFIGVNALINLLKNSPKDLSCAGYFELFKVVHHIKVGAHYLRFHQLFELSRRLETIFGHFGNEAASIQPKQVEILKEAMEKLWELVEHIRASNQMDCQKEGMKLDFLIEEMRAGEEGNLNSCEKETPHLHAQEKRGDEDQTQEPLPIRGPDKAFGGPKAEKNASPETIRVSVTLIESLMNLAGELVLGRNQLRQELESAFRINPKLNTIFQNVDAVTSEVQEDIMQMRMQPVGNLLNKFSRIVRDLARQLSKEVDLIIEGKDVELDKTMLEGLSDPLTHLVRNSLDHGIEMPAEREKKGKPRVGTLQISTFHEGGQVNIMVRDDGKGIDPEVVLKKAIENGHISADKASFLSDSEKIHLIMLPGFSTASTVTDISGRGVGMDVVKTNIEALGGQLELESNPGKGTTIRIRLPLTLAIIPSLIVGCGGLRFAIPQVNVQELFLIRSGEKTRKIEKIGEAKVLRVRERLLPLVSLAEVLGIQKIFYTPVSNQELKERRMTDEDRRSSQIKATEADHAENERRSQSNDRRKSWRNDINVVVLKIGLNSFGLIVDKLFDNEEIVVKPLSTHIKDCRCFAGATIMGDGRVAMILDAVGIAEYARLNFTEVNREEYRRRKIEEGKRPNRNGDKESILLFNSAENEFFALTLEAISRLEMVKQKDIYRIGKRDYVEYLNQSIPLIYLEDILPVKSFPKDLEHYFMLIPKTHLDPVGIAISGIQDTIEVNVDIKHDKITPPGLLGTAFVNEHLTMFLNTVELLELIYQHVPAL